MRVDLYAADLERFGAKVAGRKLENRDRAREFRGRQMELALFAGWLLFLAIAGRLPLFAAAAVFLLEVAKVEARRMRATGRYYRATGRRRRGAAP